MVFLTLMLFYAAAVSFQAQRSSQHFSGALELGTGWGHVIDFTLDNNNFSGKFLLHRLFALPWQGGIYVSRPLSATSHLEYGMLYHRRSSNWINSHASAHSGNSIYGNRITVYGTATRHEVLAMDCLDFSLKYYKFLNYWKNRELYAFGGISPVWILNIPSGSDLTSNSIPPHCFREWNLALSGGLALEKGNLRWKLNFDLGLASVFNSDYRHEIPEEDRAWGAYAFPLEALVCCAYLIN